MKYYIIAGEASGDLHASNLIKEIKNLDEKAEIRAWGGDKMEEAGATIVKHIRDLAFMGFIEVVRNLPSILKNLKFAKEDISLFNPDVIVFVDYPGFNLRMAKWARQHKLKTVFYISPQIWAWKENRVKTIKATIDQMIVILPFEKEFYLKHNFSVSYAGHPLIKVIDDFKNAHPELKRDEKLIALLPGSRKQEITSKLPIMLEATKNFQGYRFVVSKAPAVEDEFYETFLEHFQNVEKAKNNTYSVLMQASAALVTSGTATLETALFEVPEIVCYRTSSLSYKIGKLLIKLEFISLVNLIMKKEVVKELIQTDLTPEKITTELKRLLTDESYISRMKNDYRQLHKLLSQGGNASANAAHRIVDFVSQKTT